MTSNSQPTSEQFLESIKQDANRFVAAARKGLDAAVPTCPGWTVLDLLIHTGVIHRRKEQVVMKGLTDRETEVEKPTENQIDWFEEGVELMLSALRSGKAGDPAWTWHEPDQTVGFWYRRMAHEMLIHRVDAELAYGGVSDIDPVISEDGIDEALDIFIAGYPPWATLETGKSVIKLSTPDRNWFLRTGTFSGTTKSGKVLDKFPTVLLDPDASEWDCEISGSPAALNLWLWGRGSVTDLVVTGDSELANYVRNVAASAT